MDKSRPAAISAASLPSTGPFVQTSAPQGPQVWVFTILDLLVLWNVCYSLKGVLVFLPLRTQILLFRCLLLVPSPLPPLLLPPGPTLLAPWYLGNPHTLASPLRPSSLLLFSLAPQPPSFVTSLSVPGLANDPTATHTACCPVTSWHPLVHWLGVCRQLGFSLSEEEARHLNTAISSSPQRDGDRF